MNVFVATAIIGMLIFFALYAALAIGAVMMAIWIGKRSKEGERVDHSSRADERDE